MLLFLNTTNVLLALVSGNLLTLLYFAFSLAHSIVAGRGRPPTGPQEWALV